jgi:hypothetical protein
MEYIINLKIVQRRVEGKWPYSAWLIIVMWFTFLLALTSTPIATGPTFSYLYNRLYVPLRSAIGTLTAFFIAGATYRTFRARTWETGLLILVLTFVMLNNAPVGGAIWRGFPLIGTWLMDIPTTAGMRAFVITAALGMAMLGLRTLLGKEPGALGG